MTTEELKANMKQVIAMLERVEFQPPRTLEQEPAFLIGYCKGRLMVWMEELDRIVKAEEPDPACQQLDREVVGVQVVR